MTRYWRMALQTLSPAPYTPHPEFRTPHQPKPQNMWVVRVREDDGKLRPWHYVYVHSIEWTPDKQIDEILEDGAVEVLIREQNAEVLRTLACAELVIWFRVTNRWMVRI